MDFVIVGAVFFGFCAFMGHGDDEGWLNGTLKAIGLMVAFLAIVLLIAYIFTSPGESIWNNLNVHND